jgi:hypothetical protein
MVCTITVNDVAHQCHEGQSLATVLRIVCPDGYRDPLLGDRLTGPFCGMGACWECQATVDGVPGVRTCLVRVRAGTVVRTDAARDRELVDDQ